MHIRTNPQCTICTNNYEENVNHVLLECEAYTNLRNELNSDITTLFYRQNVDASFTGLLDKLCKKLLCNIFMLRSQIAE